MRLHSLLKLFVALLLAIVILVAALPWLISSAPIGGLSSPQAVASPDSRFVTIPFASTDGVTIHYLAAGRGRSGPGQDNFLLLHGFTFNAFTWNEMLDFFAERGQVIAYDQPPYGLSEKLTRRDWHGPHPYTREAAVDQLFAVMDALGLEQAVLVGNSAGGTLALEAALARPERVTRLILIAPWVFVRRPTLPHWIADLPPVASLTLWLGRYLGQSDFLLRRAYTRASDISPERRRLSTIHNKVDRWDLAWGELLHRSLTSPITISEHLDEIQQPTLVLHGLEDQLVPLSDSERLVRALPRARLVRLPGCGHLPQEECAEAVARALGVEWKE